MLAIARPQTRNPCTICGRAGIPGLLQGSGKCQFHWDLKQFGADAAINARNRSLQPAYNPWLPEPGDDNPEKLRELCLHGLCSVFAVELNARTGWTIAGLYENLRDPPLHVVCIDPEGGYADAAGRQRALETLATEYNLTQNRRQIAALDAASVQKTFHRDPSWKALIASQFEKLAPYIGGSAQK